MDRLGVLDAEFLHLEDERSTFHIAGLCIFEGPAPGRDETLRLVASKLKLLPRHRKCVRFVPLALGRPVWIDDARFDLAYHVRRTALPAPGDDDALCDLMGRLMSPMLDRTRPLWEVWFVEGLEGDRWALVSKVHHAMVDGISGVGLTERLLDESADAPLSPSEPWAPAPAPSSAALVLDAWKGLAQDTRGLARRLAAGATHPLAAARALRDTATGFANWAGRLLTLRTGALQGTIGGHRAFAHASARLADVLAIREALGGTVNDVVLSALAGGYRALLAGHGEDPDHARVRSLVPVSVRGEDARGALGNRVSAVLCDLPVHLADPLGRLHAIRAQMDGLKASHMSDAGRVLVDLGELAPPLLVGGITRLIARAMHEVPQRPLATVTTNVPGPRRPLYFHGRRLLEWFPYVPISQGLRVGTAILSYADTLGFGVTADSDSVPDAKVLARGVEAGIAALLGRAQQAREREAQAKGFHSPIPAPTLWPPI
jgi:diacylglycerol O-acyltransferase